MKEAPSGLDVHRQQAQATELDGALRLGTPQASYEEKCEVHTMGNIGVEYI